MPRLTLNLDALVVETFPTQAATAALSRPRTFEPGCTLPEICGGT